MTLEAIKEAIAELPYTEKTSLISWLNAQDAEAWDRLLLTNSSGNAGRQLIPNFRGESPALFSDARFSQTLR
jgi:hypothetical protein